MSEIIDTASGMRADKVVRQPSNAMFDDMVELQWTRGLETMKAIFPRKTAQEFLNKHLIPQQEQGILNNVGLNELEPLGTN
jgi:hypothetical protein